MKLYIPLLRPLPPAPKTQRQDHHSPPLPFRWAHLQSGKLLSPALPVGDMPGQILPSPSKHTGTVSTPLQVLYSLGTLDSLFGQVDWLPGEVCHISLGAHFSNPGQAPWGAWQGNFRVSRGTFGSCSRRLLCSRVLGIQSSQVLVLARPLFSEYPGYTESDLSPPPALCWGQCVRVLNFPLSESSFPYVYTLLHTFPHCSAHTV